MKKIIFVLFACLILLTGCSQKITEGEIYEKEFLPEETRTIIIPMIHTNGKSLYTTYVPVTHHYAFEADENDEEAYGHSNPVSGMKEDDWVKLHYHFTPNIPSNVLEESQIAGNLDGIVSQETQLGVLSVVDNVQGEIDRIQQEENQKAEYMVLGRNENSILEMITIIKEYAERNGEEPVDVFNKILGEGVNGNEE